MALDRDKAEFCYQLIRATDAGASSRSARPTACRRSISLAALRDKDDGSRDAGIVIGTEHEPGKVKAAREHLQRARLDDLVDIREGDLRETLRDLEGPIDFVLVDIWTEMARPALEIVYPHLRPGAIVVCDNTNDREAYADYFALIAEPDRHFRTMTLPFKGGFEMSVYCSPGPGPSAETQRI